MVVVDLPHISCAILNVLDGVGIGGTQESSDSGEGLHFDFKSVLRVVGCVQLNGLIESDAISSISPSFYTKRIFVA